MLLCATAAASGPRFVTGPPFFTGQAGVPIGWRQQTLLYSTDPGSLSSSVNHQAADALVAAAANAWNIPVANITLAGGPGLAEDVNGQNVYLSANGVVFPADVSSSNDAVIPLAILYDSDGAITDTLLGAGASAPSSCRQNAVTESVDAFDPAGYILHAILIVNGRCTGPAAEQQIQLQYQLQRAFGRVLGLAWSQANDNVFTGTPTPTYQQALHWPIMHPLEIICGAYTYQCLPSPFTLRSDDIASMVTIYPIARGQASPGKSPSLATAVGSFVKTTFPTGEGMGSVNLLAQVVPTSTGVVQPWIEVSAVSGYAFRPSTLSPFVAPDTSVAGSFGNFDQNAIASSLMAYIPIVDGLSTTGFTLTSEALNPLYVGTHSVGPYALGTIAPSGSNLAPTQMTLVGAGQFSNGYYTVADAAAGCSNGADGTAGNPVSADPSGWWTGVICGYGHATYVTQTIRPARTFVVEVTALDAQGLATTTKLRPVIGLFAATDSATALPSLAVAPEPFQAVSTGMTSLSAATGQATSVRLGIADQRNDGRPDYPYKARFFYGDTISPTIVGASGATAVIRGTGFRAGNSVKINGVAANVTSFSATGLVVTLPTMAQAGASDGTAVDVQILDLGTGAVATLSAALTYTSSANLPNALTLISAQSAAAYTGNAAAIPFAVRELLADGVTPVVGAPVLFSVPAGSGAFSACGGASCTVLTDAQGAASTGITPLLAGTLTMQAVDASHSTAVITASFSVLSAAGSMTILSAPSGNVYTTQAAATPFSVQVFNSSSSPMPGRSVRFTVVAGSAALSGCGCNDMTLLTDGNGQAQVQVTPQAAGTVTLRAADGNLTQQISFNALSNSDTMKLLVAPSSGAIAGQWSGSFSISLAHGDGTPDANRTVTFAGPTGVVFGFCGLTQCSVTTDSNGIASSQVKGLQAGTFTISATFGNLVETASFSVASDAPRFTIVSLPNGTQVVGQQTTQPFSVLVTDAFGNPISGQGVDFQVPSPVAIFPACNSGTCSATTDSNGIASLYLRPVAAGQITVSATYDFLSVSGSFTAAGTLGFLTVVQQPGAAGAVLNVQQTFILKLVGPDGVTPLANQGVYLRTVQGNISFTYCGSGPGCGGGTDQNGLATIVGTPSALGTVTLEGTWSTLSTTISFSVHAASDVLNVMSAPASGTVAGSAAAIPLVLQVLLPDGVTPVPAGRSVALSVSTGSATFQACGGSSTCTVLTDASGRISTAVTPLAAGTVALLATEGGGNQTATFVAAPALGAPPQPDVMHLKSLPGNGTVAGTASAAPFSVAVYASDGVTPAAGRAVTLSVSGGQATLTLCNKSSCVVTTGVDGLASSPVLPTAAGTIGLAASETSAGTNITVGGSFTAVAAPDLLKITVAPAATVTVGAATTLVVQALLADGVSPAAGKTVSFTVNTGTAALGPCSGATCVPSSTFASVVTDAQGNASIAITPLAAGPVAVTAAEGTASVAATFNTTAPPPLPDTITLVTAPTGTTPVGQPNATAFAVKLLQGDGVTPAANRAVTFAVTAGSATLAACGAATCTVSTGASGIASTTVTPTAAGIISLTATEVSLPTNTLAASFNATAPPPLPDTIALVTAPTGTTPVGQPNATAFAVKLLQGDGVTPAANRAVTFAVTAGSATLAACGAATCTVSTSATGIASTTVTPTAAGIISLTATEVSLPTNTLAASFNATAPPPLPDTIALVTAPTGTTPVGQPNATAFAVKLLQGDGVTPAANRAVTFAVTAGSATLAACGAATCTVSTSATGIASTTVTPTAAGIISLTATEVSLPTNTLAASFNATAPPPLPDTIALVTAPTGTTPVGQPNATAFAVKLLQGDGVTPAANRAVTFAVTAGSATLAACGAATCTVSTSATGIASTTVTPTAAGTITLTATEVSLPTNTLSATFNATAPPPLPDTITLVTAPTGTTPVGQPNATAFAVKLLQGDGVTPAANRAVTFAVTAGSATLAACGAATCTVSTGASGIASTTVTPTAAGTITLTATEVSLPTNTLAASFTATAPPPLPDTITLVTAPTGTTPVGQPNATAFAVKLLQGDGVTPAANRAVTFAVTAGSATLAACGAATCTISTSASGIAATTVTPTAAGTITLTATEVSLPANTLAASFNATAPPPLPDTITLVTAPTGGTPVGQPNATAFAVKLLQGDGITPAANRAVTFAVTAGSATLAACGAATCTVSTSASGIASTTVTPTAAGTISLTATEVSLPTNTLAASFTATAPPPLPDTITLVTAPTGTTPVSQPNATAFAVKLLQGDGVTPAANRAVTFAVTAGSATLAACGAATCTVSTSASGIASTTVTPTAAGTISLTATEVSLPTNTLAASFTATAPPPLPDTITLVTAPTGTTPVGQPNATAFAVKLLQGDGVTPAANRAVTFAVTAGSATLAACGAATCTVSTSATGIASTTVTPTAAGTITLTATEVSLPTNTLSATFNATAPPPLPDTITLVTAPTGTTPVGQPNATAFAVKLLQGDGVTPAANRAVTFAVTAGSATLAACGAATCTVSTSASGIASTTVTPTAAGIISLTATEVSLPTNTLAASFNATAPPPLPDTIALVTAPTGTTPVGQPNATAFAVKLLQGDGVTPAANRAVTFAVTAGSATLAACGAATCTVSTGASGIASTTVTPTAAGTITLTATEVSLPTNTLAASFNATAPPPLPDTIALVTAPTGTTPVGQPNTTAFAVKLLQGDGVTPAANRAVTFAVTAGSATLAACGAATCTVSTGASGIASTTVTPTAAGTITLTATEVSLPTNTLAASFTATAPPPLPDTITLVTAPTGTTPVGQPNATAFAVKLLQGDGVTPAANRAVTFAVTAGSATLAACGAATCTVSTSATGSASTTVTPTAAGTISLTATEVSLPANTLAASFNATAPPPLPDTIALVTAPTGTTPVGQPNATAFAVKLLQGDGVTPAANRAVTFAVTAGSATLAACGAATCTVSTSASGIAATTVTPTAAGTITLTATEVSLPANTLAASFNATAPPPLPDTITLVTAPTGGTPVGQPNATAFAVKLLQGDGITPAANRAVTFAVTAGSATLAACGAATCTVSTSASGIASTTVTPTAAGTISLTATEVSLPTNTLAASFTATAPPPLPDTITLVTAPTGTTPVGQPNATAFAVKLLQGDGVTPAANRAVTFAVTAGSATLAACGAATCTVSTGASGIASTTVTPTAAGIISLTATEVSLPTNTLAASFNATAPPPLPDTIALVTAPTGTTPVGQPNATAFAVKLLQGDGVTPAANRAVTFAVTAGSATLAACGAATCTVSTGASGIASTTVTPTAAGTITLTATEVSLPTNTLAASFTATAPPPLPDTIALVTAPTGTTPVGQPNATAFAVKLLQGDGVTPAANRAVTFAVTAGSATLAACGAATCTVSTSAIGIASTTVTPTAAGTITLTATEVSLPTNTLAASFNATAPPPLPDTIALVTAPTGTTPVGQPNATAFAVKLLQGDGVTPAANRAVTFAVTAGSATLAACGAATCTVSTGASGIASTTVTPTAAGTITLTATEVSLPTNTLAASFNATAPPPLPDTIALVTAPTGTTPVGQPNTTAFAVKLLQGDGVTPAANRAVTFAVTAGSATLAACGAATCTVSTGASGIASTTVTPTAAGTITLTATEVSLPTNTLAASFTATAPPPLPDTITLVTAPTGTTPVGQPNATAFAVKLLQGDGVTPAAKRAVTFAVTAGSATLAACGAATCTVSTSAIGIASTTVTPTAAGTISLTATEVSLPTNTLAASFTAVEIPIVPPPVGEMLAITVSPGVSAFLGTYAAAPFTVLLTLSDGITPVAGVPVTFANSSGAGQVSFAACGLPTCSVTTSTSGVASTRVLATGAGAVTLSASAPSPGAGLAAALVTTPFQVVANQLSLIALEPQIFLAEGSTQIVDLSAAALQNGAPPSGLQVVWQATGAVQLLASQTTTRADGSTAAQATIGPLAGGAQAVITACAWTSICATFTALGVSAGGCQVAIVSGGWQTLSRAAATAFAPVLVQVTDAAGHPIAGAAVSVYQQVTTLAAACPSSGRCPAEPIQSTQVSLAVTDANGTITATPLPGGPANTHTRMAFSAGTQGFATTVLTSLP